MLGVGHVRACAPQAPLACEAHSRAAPATHRSLRALVFGAQEEDDPGALVRHKTMVAMIAIKDPGRLQKAHPPACERVGGALNFRGCP